jgi:hypothetical protein
MPTKYYIKDCPKELTIVNWLKGQTDWSELICSTKPKRNYPQTLIFNINNFDPEIIKDSILESTKLYGEYGWRHARGSDNQYTGFSLVYNPDHQDNLPVHASTLGTPKNKPEQFVFGSIETHSDLKNSYFDSYGFNTQTPASKHSCLGEFISRSRRTLIRSRMSILNGSVGRERGWHKDEIIFENLRINIPITTNENFLFQIKDHDPIHLPVGKAYSWDTHVLHRVFTPTVNDFRRMHIVLGFSPWWNYLSDEQAWVQNEFYGVKHPFDMLADGDIFEGLSPDSSIE